MVLDLAQKPQNEFTSLVGKRWIDGHTTIGVDSSVARKHKEEVQSAKEWNTADDKQWYKHRCVDEDNQEFASFEISHYSAYDLGYRSEYETLQALSLSLAAIPRKPTTSRSKKGHKGITSYGRRLLKCGAYYFEKRYPKSQIGLATVTLPPLPDEVTERVTGKDWGLWKQWLQEEIQRELRRKRSRCPYIVATVELQEARGLKTGVYMPHMHFIYVTKRLPCKVSLDNPWYLTAYKLRAINKRVTARLINHVLTNKKVEVIEVEPVSPVIFVPVQPELCMDAIDSCINAETDELQFDLKVCIDAMEFGASCNVQTIKKSVVGYISKYLTKGGKSIDAVIKNGGEKYLISQWWYVSKPIKRFILDSIDNFTSDVCSFIYYNAVCLYESGLIQKLHYVKHTYCSFKVKKMPDGAWMQTLEDEVTTFGLSCSISDDVMLQIKSGVF